MITRNSIIISCFIICNIVLGQSTVSGTISDKSGNPLDGANVTIDGTSYGGAAVVDGNYVIKVPS